MMPAQAQIAISCTASRAETDSVSKTARGPMRSTRPDSQLATIAAMIPIAPARKTE